MHRSVEEKLKDGPMCDMAIVEHHFTPYLRDYDVLVDVCAAAPPEFRRSYIEGRYRYRFTHCVRSEVTSAVDASTWRISWDDRFTVYQVWRDSGEPDGYVWGVCYSNAYPGLRYIKDSDDARRWSQAIGKPMHEIIFETNGHNIRLVFHDVSITKVAQGDPISNELTPLDQSQGQDRPTVKDR